MDVWFKTINTFYWQAIDLMTVTAASDCILPIQMLTWTAHSRSEAWDRAFLLVKIRMKLLKRGWLLRRMMCRVSGGAGQITAVRNRGAPEPPSPMNSWWLWKTNSAPRVIYPYASDWISRCLWAWLKPKSRFGSRTEEPSGKSRTQVLRVPYKLAQTLYPTSALPAAPRLPSTLRLAPGTWSFILARCIWHLLLDSCIRFWPMAFCSPHSSHHTYELCMVEEW